MLVAVGLLAVAAAVLVAGAELFVERLGGAAARLGLTTLATALLLAGAEPEEALTAVLAAADGRPALGVGDAVGAAVTVLTLVLGLAALLAPVPLGPRVGRYAALAAVASALAALALADGAVGRPEALGLLAAYVVLVAAVWWRDRRPPVIGELAELAEDSGEDGAEDGDEDGAEDGSGSAGPAGSTPGGVPEAAPHAGAGRDLALAVVGLAVMTAGGALAVAGATRLVRELGASDTAVGLTVLALATSAEMLALVAAAARRRVAEVAVAGLVGAVLYNATVSLAAGPLVTPATGMGPAPAAAALGCALLSAALAVAARRTDLRRVTGLILVVAYCGYLVITIVR